MKKLFRDLQKHKYIKVISFDSTKSMIITYIKKNKFKPNYLIDPNHVFNHAGYQTIVISDTSAQTINPLDFKSKYPVNEFRSAISSKIISETFGNLKSDKIDLMKVMMFANLIVTLVLLFMLLKSNGVI